MRRDDRPAVVERCGTCRANRGEFQNSGGVIYQDRLWRLEHCIEPIPVAGWLVLKPLRHVEAFADLTEEEAESFGPLVRLATRAMREVLQPAKVYVCLFSESEGFAHIHVHLIPRFAETPHELHGAGVFDLLRRAGEEQRNLGDVAAAAEVAAAVLERLQAGR
ncbi:MAG: HIT domain-containing protein [Chloroflexi bacterium]|nr:HIT domain-containing protein [Chloroflexota bacterium]